MEEAVLEVASSSSNILGLETTQQLPFMILNEFQSLFQNLIQVGEVCLLSSGPLVKSKYLQIT